MERNADTLQVVAVTTFNQIGLFRLGGTLIEKQLKLASIAFVKSYTPTYLAEEIQQAVIFIHGSAMETTIRMFGIGVDADKLRESFFTLCEKRRKHEMSVLSSAITQAI